MSTKPNKSLADTISSNYMRITLTNSSVSFNKADPKGRAALAAKNNASEKAYRVIKSLIPEGFDSELKALTEARSTCKKIFDAYTTHAAKSANGERNEGEKWIRSKYYTNGEFLAAWNPAHQEFLRAHGYFVQQYPHIIDSIELASQQPGCGLGDDFDRSKYPSLQDVRDKFAVSYQGPFPIAGGEVYREMPMDDETRARLEAMYDADLRRNLAVVSQNVASDLAARLATMAENLSKLAEFNRTPPHLRKGKATAIHDTLVTNLQDAVAKARSFAIPETEAGSKLLAMVDQVEELLDPDRLDADYLKTLPVAPMATMASHAESLAAALAACDWE